MKLHRRWGFQERRETYFRRTHARWAADSSRPEASYSPEELAAIEQAVHEENVENLSKYLMRKNVVSTMETAVLMAKELDKMRVNVNSAGLVLVANTPGELNQELYSLCSEGTGSVNDSLISMITYAISNQVTLVAAAAAMLALARSRI